MSDSQEFRRWANQAHKDSMRSPKKKRKNPLFNCTGCNMRTTKNQGAKNNWNCPHCGSPLRIRAEVKP